MTNVWKLKKFYTGDLAYLFSQFLTWNNFSIYIKINYNSPSGIKLFKRIRSWMLWNLVRFNPSKHQILYPVLIKHISYPCRLGLIHTTKFCMHVMQIKGMQLSSEFYRLAMNLIGMLGQCCWEQTLLSMTTILGHRGNSESKFQPGNCSMTKLFLSFFHAIELGPLVWWWNGF